MTDITQVRPSWQTNPVPVPEPEPAIVPPPEQDEPDTQWLDMQE